MTKQEDEVKGANEFSISCKYLRWITLCSLKPHDRSWSLLKPQDHVEQRSFRCRKCRKQARVSFMIWFATKKLLTVANFHLFTLSTQLRKQSYHLKPPQPMQQHSSFKIQDFSASLFQQNLTEFNQGTVDLCNICTRE